MNQGISEVVNDYKLTVAKVLNLLESKFGEINYILAKNGEQIPKRGFLDEDKKISYNLHGAGITVNFTNSSIVFDFDFQSSNHFGFDAWQIERFIKTNERSYPELGKLDYGNLKNQIQYVLDELENKGKIEFNPTTNRYYPLLNTGTEN